MTEQREGESMDALKRTAREVETRVKHAVRSVDGTDLNDHVANAGDEVRKELGNFGDGVRRAGRRARIRSVDPGPRG
jgi:hypothetical protein